MTFLLKRKYFALAWILAADHPVRSLVAIPTTPPRLSNVDDDDHDGNDDDDDDDDNNNNNNNNNILETAHATREVLQSET